MLFFLPYRFSLMTAISNVIDFVVSYRVFPSNFIATKFIRINDLIRFCISELTRGAAGEKTSDRIIYKAKHRGGRFFALLGLGLCQRHRSEYLNIGISLRMSPFWTCCVATESLLTMSIFSAIIRR